MPSEASCCSCRHIFTMGLSTSEAVSAGAGAAAPTRPETSCWMALGAGVGAGAGVGSEAGNAWELAVGASSFCPSWTLCRSFCSAACCMRATWMACCCCCSSPLAGSGGTGAALGPRVADEVSLSSDVVEVRSCCGVTCGGGGGVGEAPAWSCLGDLVSRAAVGSDDLAGPQLAPSVECSDLVRLAAVSLCLGSLPYIFRLRWPFQ
mmetsp:Transcript_17487/g.44736  ORF Transcript_17487/g.44736 Transcript_17487/m.44736 type:complete len:206 (-) Transcript_17487:272-889(-)